MIYSTSGLSNNGTIFIIIFFGIVPSAVTPVIKFYIMIL